MPWTSGLPLCVSLLFAACGSNSDEGCFPEEREEIVRKQVNESELGAALDENGQLSVADCQALCDPTNDPDLRAIECQPLAVAGVDLECTVAIRAHCE